MRVSSTLRAAFALVGFTAVIAQIVLMRELLVAFYGNEISLGIILANWLLWTAVGSGVLGWFGRGLRNPRRLFAVLQVVVAIAFPATIFLVRASKIAFHPMPGEILGPGAMFLTSLAALGVFCLASGTLFAVGSRVFTAESGARADEASSSVYLLEAAGSGIGGILASLVLIRYLDTFQIAFAVSFLNFLAAASISRRSLPFSSSPCSADGLRTFHANCSGADFVWWLHAIPFTATWLSWGPMEHEAFMKTASWFTPSQIQRPRKRQSITPSCSILRHAVSCSSAEE
jgi:hypothetical protein